MAGTKIKLEKELYQRVKEFSDGAGYSSVEEFVSHVLEEAVGSNEQAENEEVVKQRLQGLGYLK